MDATTAAQLGWPDSLAAVGGVRFSRSSGAYDSTVAFYRDVLELPFLGDFIGSFGEDGTIFGLPGLAAHLEIVRAHAPVPAVDPLDQLVLYLSGAAAMTAVVARLEESGTPRDPAPHPYWSARGGRVFLDPDGRRVVLAPWVFGHEPEPGSGE